MHDPADTTKAGTVVVEPRSIGGFNEGDKSRDRPFKKIEELMNVQGIGEKSFLKLRPQLSVAKPDGQAQE